MSFFAGGIVSSASDRSAGPDANVRRTYNPGGDEKSAEYSAFQMEKVQHFGILGAMVNISLLLLSCLSFVIVTIFHHVLASGDSEYLQRHLLPVSHASAIVIISAYAAYIVFQLGTHRTALAA